MRVELIKQTNLRDKALELTGSKDAFDDFINKIRDADWQTANDINNTFATADLIGDERIIFDLPKHHRLVCCYNFITDLDKPWIALYICWVGSHKEYNILNDNLRRNKEPNLKTVWEF